MKIKNGGKQKNLKIAKDMYTDNYLNYLYRKGDIDLMNGIYIIYTSKVTCINITYNEKVGYINYVKTKNGEELFVEL